MQNAQNNLSVETIVAKYRNYVNEHCPKWIDNIVDEGEVFDVLSPKSPDGNADEQLIVTLYQKVIGSNVNASISHSPLEKVGLTGKPWAISGVDGRYLHQSDGGKGRSEKYFKEEIVWRKCYFIRTFWCGPTLTHSQIGRAHV